MTKTFKTLWITWSVDHKLTFHVPTRARRLQWLPSYDTMVVVGDEYPHKYLCTVHQFVWLNIVLNIDKFDNKEQKEFR